MQCSGVKRPSGQEREWPPPSASLALSQLPSPTLISRVVVPSAPCTFARETRRLQEGRGTAAPRRLTKDPMMPRPPILVRLLKPALASPPLGIRFAFPPFGESSSLCGRIVEESHSPHAEISDREPLGRGEQVAYGTYCRYLPSGPEKRQAYTTDTLRPSCPRHGLAAIARDLSRSLSPPDRTGATEVTGPWQASRVVSGAWSGFVGARRTRSIDHDHDHDQSVRGRWATIMDWVESRSRPESKTTELPVAPSHAPLPA